MGDELAGKQLAWQTQGREFNPQSPWSKQERKRKKKKDGHSGAGFQFQELVDFRAPRPTSKQPVSQLVKFQITREPVFKKKKRKKESKIPV